MSACNVMGTLLVRVSNYMSFQMAALDCWKCCDGNAVRLCVGDECG